MLLDECGVTAASTFFAPAAKLARKAELIEAPITRVPVTNATPAAMANEDSASRAFRYRRLARALRSTGLTPPSA